MDSTDGGGGGGAWVAVGIANCWPVVLAPRPPRPNFGGLGGSNRGCFGLVGTESKKEGLIV